jgi:exosortase/archaeosortase family protein
MKIEDKKFLSIVLRYLFLALIAIPGFDLFYFIFLPLTKFSTFYLLNLFYEPAIFGNVIFILGKSIEIVNACVAGSAYYFLLILNFSTPNIKSIKRLKMILFGFLTFLGINIARIFILSVMYLNDSQFFDFTHKLFWYLGSTLLIVVIWFVQVRKNKVRSIPFYSDLKYIYGKSNFKNKHKK